MKFEIPPNILFLMSELETHGYEAYIVGGAVRDMLLETPVHDYDVATSATPEQVMEVFSSYQVIPTGIKHGTVTVVLEDDSCEVTTYRSDGKYTDSRHPDSITFETDITKDLARRDFTFNAIAYKPPLHHKPPQFIDPYNGIEALGRGVIEVVGATPERFQEDPLRIMRLLRFYMQLSHLHPQTMTLATYKAALDHMGLLRQISAERIRDELSKILLWFDYKAYQADAQYQELFKAMLKVVIPEAERCVDYQQYNPYHHKDLLEHTLLAIDFLNQSKYSRLDIALALFFHDIGKPDTAILDDKGVIHFYAHAIRSVELTKEIMTRLRFDTHTIEKVAELVQHHDATLVPTKHSINRMINRLHHNQYEDLWMVCNCDWLAHNPSHPRYQPLIVELDACITLYREMQQAKQIITRKDLAINGNDIMDIGIPQGKQVGLVLENCLQMVISEQMPNDNRKLRAYVRLLKDTLELGKER